MLAGSGFAAAPTESEDDARRRKKQSHRGSRRCHETLPPNSRYKLSHMVGCYEWWSRRATNAKVSFLQPAGELR